MRKPKRGCVAARARARSALVENVNDSSSWVFGAVTGLAYVYMVAAWGGYIFVLNMIAFHAVILAMGRYTPKLHKAYTLFYLIGTYGAIQVPVVGLTPLKSMEQLGALGVFGIIQVSKKSWTLDGSSILGACAPPLLTFYFLLLFVSPCLHTHTHTHTTDEIAVNVDRLHHQGPERPKPQVG